MNREYSRFSSADSDSHTGTSGSCADSAVPSGMIPMSIWRWWTIWRYSSHPESNWPVYLSAHSLGTWCGAWPAPVA